MDRDIEIDLRKPQKWTELVSQAGGYPLLVLPLDSDLNAIAQGRACQDARELAAALGWAISLSSHHRVRLIPVEARKPDVEFG